MTDFDRSVFFPAWSLLPDVIASNTQDIDEDFGGWHVSKGNPGELVDQYSHLRVKEGYKLVGYVYRFHHGGSGTVKAMPIDAEIPEPLEKGVKEGGLDPEPFKLRFSAEATIINPMAVIEGSEHPLSYLQASMLNKNFNEYGEFWHGCSGLRALPLTDAKEERSCEWDFVDLVPESWEPKFYRSKEGYPTIVYYEWKYAMGEAIYEITCIFDKTGYTSTVQRKVIATGAELGIIF